MLRPSSLNFEQLRRYGVTPAGSSFRAFTQNLSRILAAFFEKPAQ